MSKQKKRRKKRKNPDRRLIRIAVGVVAAALVLAAGVVSGVYLWLRPYVDYPYILPNVYFAGVDLSGLTREQARDRVAKVERESGGTVEVLFPDGASYSIRPNREFREVDMDAVARTAANYGHTSNETPLRVYRAIQLAKDSRYDIPLSVGFDYDKADVRAQVEEIVDQVMRAPEPATGTGDTEAMTVTVTPGAQGRSADVEQLYQAACAAVENGAASISAAYTETGIDQRQLSDLTDKLYDTYAVEPQEPQAALDVVNHTVIITMGSPGWTFDKEELAAQVQRNAEVGLDTPVTMAMEEVAPPEPNLAQIAARFSSDPTEVEYHDGGLTGGEVGYQLNIEAAAQAIAASGYGESCTVPMDEVSPTHTLEEMETLLFRDVLGSHATYHTSDYNRTTNLRLACQELDGIVMNAGATFSFNTFVGERTADRGFRNGVVYVDGEHEVELGGGVCQVASTIYYAALLAGMEIVDRAPHEFMVTYVPGGLDATVYWGVQDFCFKNTSGYPIRLNAEVYGGQVHISIEGTNDTGVYRTLSSTRTKTDEDHIYYESYQNVYDRSGYLLETNDLGVSRYEKE